jgi:hypothetical protein
VKVDDGLVKKLFVVSARRLYSYVVAREWLEHPG